MEAALTVSPVLEMEMQAAIAGHSKQSAFQLHLDTHWAARGINKENTAVSKKIYNTNQTYRAFDSQKPKQMLSSICEMNYTEITKAATTQQMPISVLLGCHLF